MTLSDQTDSTELWKEMNAAVSSVDPLDSACQSPLQPTEPFRILNEDGTLTAAGKTMDVSTQLAQDLYEDMVMARRLDHEALSLQRQGELHLWLMSWGQEAAQVGSVRAIRPNDMVFPSYREHAAALCRGISPADVMRQWRGVSHSGWDSAEHRFHINSLVLGTQTLHATGYAAGVKMDRADEVVLTYFGDGSASQGDVNEAFNWSAAGNLPILFFCQNNQWAISTPTSTQMLTPVHVRAAGFGLTGYHVDGNDVLAVHAVTKQAVERVRSGGGPALIEAQTYRVGGHSSSDDPKRYRSDEELTRWQQKDPLARVEKFLRSSGLEESYFKDLADREEAFAATVREQCRSIEGDDLDAVFDQTYVNPHPVMREEKVAYMARSRKSVA